MALESVSLYLLWFAVVHTLDYTQNNADMPILKHVLSINKLQRLFLNLSHIQDYFKD